MSAIIKSPKTITRGMRHRVRTFKYRDDMHKFLNTADNAIHWRECKDSEPQRSGTYVFAGGQYHNVRSIDPCALAHL